MFRLFKNKQKKAASVRKNALIAIKPYFEHGMWVFDDDTVGLVKEPFILGVPEILETAVKEKGIKDAEKGFTAIFSSGSFPQYDVKLDLLGEEDGGAWYVRKETGQKGWFCPALFCYFETAPENLFIKLETLKKRAEADILISLEAI